MTEQYRLECEYLTETEEALKVSVHGEVHWFPLSTVDSITKRKDGTCTVVIAAWIAKKKGLI